MFCQPSRSRRAMILRVLVSTADKAALSVRKYIRKLPEGQGSTNSRIGVCAHGGTRRVARGWRAAHPRATPRPNERLDFSGACELVSIFPLINPITCETAYFGGTEINMRT